MNCCPVTLPEHCAVRWRRFLANANIFAVYFTFVTVETLTKETDARMGLASAVMLTCTELREQYLRAYSDTEHR